MNTEEQYAHKPEKLMQRVCLALVLVNMAVYLMLLIRGVNWLDPRPDDLIRWGGNFAPLTLTDEPWRLFSSMFLHAGIWHLAVNMYMLFILGALVEKQYGSVRFTVIYLLSGLGGGLLSAFWHGYHKVNAINLMGGSFTQVLKPIVSVGASGALMGLAGACLVARLAEDRHYNDSEKDAEFKAVGQVILLNLAMGFMMKGIDQACHIGGLLTGTVTGLLLMWSSRSSAKSRHLYPVLLACAGMAASIGIASKGANDGLIELRDQVFAEREAELKEAGEAERKAEAKKNEELARLAHEAELKKLPPPVEEHIARGTQIAVGNDPIDMAESPDGKRLYVTNNTDNTVSILDLESKTLSRIIDGGKFPSGDGCLDNICRGQGAYGIAISPDERYAYVTSMRKDALAVIDLEHGKVTNTVKLGRFPRDIRLSQDGKRAYIANGVDDTISFISFKGDEVAVETLPIPGEGSAAYQAFGRSLALLLSNDNKQLYVISGGNGMAIFDAVTRDPRERIALAGGLDTVTQARKEQALWLSGRSAIVMMDPGSLKPRRGYRSCYGEIEPRSFAISADGSLFAFADRSDNKIHVIKVASGRTVGIYPAGSNPVRTAFSRDGKSMYVLNAGDRTVSILDRSKSLDVKSAVQNTGEPLCPLDDIDNAFQQL